MNVEPDTQEGAHPCDVGVGLLLAGGSGTRIGVDKRLLTLDGRPLILRALDFLRRHFDRVAVSVSADRPLDLGTGADGVEIVTDRWHGGSPLAGLASGLASIGAPLFAMATDLPFPDDRALARLRAAWLHDVDICLPTVGDQFEPLFALYHTRCLPVFRDLLEADRHRIAEAFPSLNVLRVPFPDDSPFANVNTVEDYRTVRELVDADCRPFPGPTAARRRPGVLLVTRADDGDEEDVSAVLLRLTYELTRLGLCVAVIRRRDRTRGASDAADGRSITEIAGDCRPGAASRIDVSPSELSFTTAVEHELPLDEIARRLCGDCDLVLATGYPGDDRPQITVGEGSTRLFLTPASSAPGEDTGRPIASVGPDLVVDDIADLAAFLVMRLDRLRISRRDEA